MREDFDHEELTVSEAAVAAVAGPPWKRRILAALRDEVRDLTGIELEAIDTAASFLEVGVDSLLLIQASQRFQERFGVKLTLVQLLEDLTTLDNVAAYLLQQLPPERLAQLLPEPRESPAIATPPLPPAVSTSAAPPAPILAVSTAAPRSPLAVPASQPAVARASRAAQPSTPPPAAAPAAGPAAAGAGLELVVSQQLALMALQIELLAGGDGGLSLLAAPAAAATLGGAPAVAALGPPAQDVAPVVPAVALAAPRVVAAVAAAELPVPGVAPALSAEVLSAPAMVPAVSAVVSSAPHAVPAGRTVVVPAAVAPAAETYAQFGPYHPLEVTPGKGLTQRQQSYLERFIGRYTARTAGSKQMAQRYRRVLADGRGSVGFRRPWKELVYPIHGARSQGSRLWDVDGNEYVDINMGFGLHFFGHSPAFVVEALVDQLGRGMELGPQSPLVGEVAELVCGLAGVERVAFCNSGTEAVMGALRAARTYTRRSRVALFANSYHGWFDGTLARGRMVKGQRIAVPAAPGVPPGSLADVVVLEYDAAESLAYLAEHGGELAAVLVEPVRSRSPEQQPREFLHGLREVTQRTGAVLIFDEMVTGFRVHPGGAQAHFGVRADLATYGKLVAAGLPIGVVAGRSEVMDVLDGGMWSFGDDSYPRTEKTMFAGAFFKHPLTMAAARAVLGRMREEGPGLQAGLNARTAALAAELNGFFHAAGAPLSMVHFGSLFRFRFGREAQLTDLFTYHLLEQGVFYTLESGNCFLSPAHGDAEVERIVTAVRASVTALQRGGFLPGEPPPGAPSGPPPERTVTPAPERTVAPPPLAATPLAATDEARPAAGEGLDEVVPLTEAQRAMWLEAQMDADANRACNEPMTLRLRGHLDVGAMAAALARVVERHAALRATVTADGSRWRIAPRLEVGIAVVDLSGLPDDRRAAAEAAWLALQVGEGLDLERGPLLRCGVARLGGEEHDLSLTVHHLVIDGYSAGVLTRELQRLYRAACRREAVALGAPGAFGRHVTQTAAAQVAGSLAAAEAYWGEVFADRVPYLELPTDRPRPRLVAYRGSRRTWRPAGALSGQLRKLGAGQGATLLMTLLAAYGMLLGRLSGQEDLVVGMPSRDATPGGPMVGFFITMLPLRLRLREEASFGEALGEVKRAVLAAQSHPLPLNRLMQRLGAQSDAARRLLSATFNLERHGEPPAFFGLQTENLRVHPGVTRFDLTLTAVEESRGLLFEGEYRAELFDPTTVERWLASLATLLAGIVAAPDARLGSLPLLGAGERQQVLVEWNDTAVAPIADRCLHELFAELVASDPEALAVVCEGESLSRRELDRRSNRLAHHLRSLGAGPEVLVGIHLELGNDAVIAVLGVLKSGGAYLGLDPDLPAARLAALCADARLGVLITRSAAAAAAAPAGVRTVHLEEDAAALHRQPEDDLPPAATPQNLAYAIYTSGSTGKPKRVGGEHRQVTAYLAAVRERLQLPPAAVFAMHHTLAVDAGVTQLFAALCHGGVLELVVRERALDHALFGALFAEQPMDCLKTAPSHLAALLEGPLPLRILPRRLVILGGEALSGSLELQILSLGRGCAVLNEYGPTETTVGVLTHLTRPGEPRTGSATVPIGRPLANVSAYVLDAGLAPVPPGVVGELFIGGRQVTRGYLGQPHLTAVKYLPDPYSSQPGARMYRTGDFVRLGRGGVVEYLGRTDHQVKVRGFRVELEEIESTLRQHPAVQSGVVIARGEASAGVSLTAYVVLHAGASAPPGERAAELVGFLRERLPDYMVPAACVVVPALPLTPMGKVDRKALPDLEGTAREAPGRQPGAPIEDVPGAGSSQAPGTPAEDVVASIWSEVLGVARVGRGDSFYALGGHSLNAMQAVARVRRAFKVEISVRALFAAPTLSGFAELLERLVVAGDRPPLPPIQAVPRGHDLPLSFAQQRLWFLDRLEPGLAAYNLPAAIRLAGRFDAAAFSRSLSEVVRRHEPLRTTFAERDDGPVQIVRPAGATVALPVVDLMGCAPSRSAAIARQLAGEEALRPFDLTAGPLLRSTLLRLERDEHVLLLNLHHIASDGWSMGILVRELATLYRAFAAGRPSPLAELPIQYADFAVWQRSWLRGEALATQLGYWRRALDGAPATLALATDRPRAAVQSYRGASQALQLPAALSAAVRELCRRQVSTLAIGLLAAFKLLLARHSGQSDLVVGTPIANRRLVETEDLIGFFANTLVLRTTLAAGARFSDLMRQVRETVFAAHAHQDLPFEKLVEELAPHRDMSQDPLFQVMFVAQTDAPQPPALPGLALVPLAIPDQTAKFDLMLQVGGEEERLSLALAYRTDLFEAHTASRLLRQLQQVLEAVTADPELPVEAVPLLGEGERQQMLLEWNDSGRGEAWRGVEERFAAQARARPEAPAVGCEGEAVSYGELARRSEALARALSARGVGGESLVGLLAPRGIGLVVAVLGVLKAGGAYLPLDPQHPPQRLAQVLEGSGARLVLVDAALEERLAAACSHLSPARRPSPLRLEAGGVVATERKGLETTPAGPGSGARPAGPGGREELAYVIFTSGSTGVPKGVMVTRGGMVNHLLAKIEALDLTPEDVVAQTASQCFDISVWQMLSPLLAGGRVEVFGDEAAGHPHRLLAGLGAAGVTVFQTVPSLLAALLEEAEGAGVEASLPRLRWLIPTGEALSPELCRRWLGRFPRVPLVNAYGPTECSDDVTHQLIATPPAAAAARVAIGRPLRNTRLYLTDRGGRLLPPGAVGELWVGGAGVGRGYLGEGGRTAEVFVPDPWGEEAGERLYRTGDLGRRQADGTLEFHGRRDHQVKVRGFRIELGEIESALRRHEAVTAAVVLERSAAGGRQLVAYVVALATSFLAAGSLAGRLGAYLRERLPDYMVPAAFVVVPALPLTPQGKVDRRALAAMAAAGAALPGAEEREGAVGATGSSPRGPAEELMAGLWQEALEVGRVGREEDFFALGGHSLLATRVVSRVRRAFAVEVPVRAVFEQPTVARLAAYVTALRGARSGAAVPPPLVRGGGTGPAPLSFAQQRLWFLEQLSPSAGLYNVATALSVSGPLDVGWLARSLDEVVRRHEALRTRFVAVAGEPWQQIAPPGPVGVGEVDLRGLRPALRRAEGLRRVAELSLRGFDLQHGPLLRVAVLWLGEEEALAALVMHHIVSDGWSSEVLVRELAALYGAFAAGRPAPLAELAVQYADYARWQREWLSGERLEQELAYWRAHLAGAPAVLELPLDRPRPALKTFRGGVSQRDLRGEQLAVLEAAARCQGATLFMLLLAGLGELLGRYAGKADVVIGVPIAGRTRVELEELIGFFVNTLALRVELGGELAVGEALARVREMVLSAHAHQELPFEKLVEELAPPRDLSSTPVFQVMLALQQVSGGPPRLPGLRLSSLVEGWGDRAAKFDLTLLAQGLEGGGLGLGLEYNADLFDRVTAERMLGHLLSLLGEIAAAPQRRLEDLRLLTAGERHQVVAEWGRSLAAVSGESGEARAVHQLVADWARLSPQAEALRCGGVGMSYGELGLRVERLAGWLRGLGVVEESRVGLCVEPSPAMIVGLLAVLAAGGAYVPLDAAQPAERLAGMAVAAGVRVLLCQQRQRGVLAELDLVRVELDGEGQIQGADPDAFAAAPAAGPGAVAGGRDLGERPPGPWPASTSAAYVLFTSGSTGAPKGVVATHGGLAAFARAMGAALGLSAGDRMLQFASLSFDASAVQIFPTLTRGAALVLHPNVRGLSPAELDELCAAERVTVLDLPAALWRQWVAEGATTGRPPAAPLRWVMTGGEEVPGSALAQWAGWQGPGVGFWSSYGPTEATVTAAAFQTRSDDVARRGGGEVPMGRPLGEARLYLLDDRLRPVPLGVVGEVYLGGVGVTRGYLGQPEKTAERYVPDPFGAAPGGRLYRTGDLARWRPDGQSRFLGRRDRQVKLRGFRVELGEVEAALAGCPGVREALVAMGVDAGGEPRLIGYVVARHPGELSPPALAAALRERLPAPMVPAAFVELPELPLLASGKVDYRALPAPEWAGPTGPAPQVAPRTALELELVQLWEELLGVSPIGVTDSFFEVGGHSLLAVRLVARLRQRFAAGLPLAVLFEAPTVRLLAARLAASGTRPAATALVALRAQGSRPPLFFVHPIGGEVLGYYRLARHLGPEQPFFGLQASTLDEQAGAPHLTIAAMAAEYVTALLPVRPHGPYLLGGASFGGVVAFEMAQQLRRAGEETSLLALLDTPLPPGRSADAELDTATVISALAREQARQRGRELSFNAAALAGLDLEAQLELALAALRELAVIGSEVDVPMLRRFIAGYRARMQAVERYQAEPYPGLITLFRPLDADPEHLRAYSAEQRRRFDEPTLGWGAVAGREGVRVLRVPGFHETMTAEPHVGALARALAACIGEIETAAAAPAVAAFLPGA
jgi:amino acid adenylation domain-containing protein